MMTIKIKKRAIVGLMLLPMGLANASESDMSLKMLLGVKTLESDWGKDDSMDTIGFQITYQPTSIPVGVALDVYGSGNEEKNKGVKTETTVGEVNLGVRWQPKLLANSLAPYLGAGVSFAAAELQELNSGTKNTYEDNGTGFWVGGGVDYLFAKHWSIGIDARYSTVDVKLNGKTRDAGGVGWGATVGYHF